MTQYKEIFGIICNDKSERITRGCLAICQLNEHNLIDISLLRAISELFNINKNTTYASGELHQ